MKIKILKKLKTKKGAIVAPVFTEDLKKLPLLYGENIKSFIKDRVKNNKFDGKDQKYVTFLDTKDAPNHLFVIGAGNKADFSANKARNLGAKISKQMKFMKEREVSILLPDTLITFIGEFLEGYIMAQYNIEMFKTDAIKKKNINFNTDVLHLILNSVTKSSKEAVEKAQLRAEAVNYVRDLVNSPANKIDADFLTNEAKRIAKQNRYKKVFLGLKELKKMKAGGILSVNQGCKREPKLLVLQHDGASKREKPIVLVGKGVVFDTGGYNLKRGGHIEEMHQDMAGAATVMGIMDVVKKLKIKKNIIAVMPIVENLINEDAYRPSDIITMLSGNTVEVTNTDAEGRIILADAIHYATELDPEMILTIATLTGASFAALGHRYSALMANNSDLMKKMQISSQNVDDLAWSLPIHDDYHKEIESSIADFRNFDRGSGGGAGASKAAAFLEKFVKDNKWCHIDIGGTAFTTRPKPYETKGATAHGFRMLIEFLDN